MPMSRLELAAEQLAEALEKLEKAADSTGRPAPVASGSEQRLAILEGEKQQLLARIAALEEELAALSGITEDVEGRLDGAIGEIRAALARS
jgi:chromosome segregation ATPase